MQKDSVITVCLRAAFTLNLKPKPTCPLGATLCVSLYLVRQLAQPLIFQRPQHATDRIMNLSPAGFTGSHSAANTDCAFRQINLQTSRQCDNLSLIVLCVRGGVRQRCNVQRDSSEKGAGVRHRPKGMLAEDHGTG